VFAFKNRDHKIATVLQEYGKKERSDAVISLYRVLFERTNSGCRDRDRPFWILHSAAPLRTRRLCGALIVGWNSTAET